MEDNLQILKVEYLSNHFLDHTQILDLSLNDQPYFTNPQNEDYFWWKMTSKLVEYEFWVLRGKFEENSEEIPSVALLSPACSFHLFQLYFESV